MIENGKTYLKCLKYGIDFLLENNSKVYLLGEDVAEPYGGAFKITNGLSDKYPGRVLNTPMSEQGFTGLGLGMALAGQYPIVEIMFGDFVTLTMDQLLNHGSKFVGGYKKKLHFVLRTPMGGYRGYGATHSQSLEKLYLGLPHIQIVTPSVVFDPGKLLIKSIELGEIILFVENKLDYSRKMFSSENNYSNFEVTYSSGDFPICRINIKGETPMATIITYGGMVAPAINMVEKIYIEEELPIRILAISNLSEIDYSWFLDSLKDDKYVFTLEEGHLPYGVGDGIVSNLAQMGLKTSFITFGAKNEVIGASMKTENSVLPNFSDIENRIKDLLL